MRIPEMLRGRKAAAAVAAIVVVGVVGFAVLQRHDESGGGAGKPPAPPAPRAAGLPPPPAAVPEPWSREEVFSVDHFGRYAVAAVSPVGAQIQLIDRMAGPGPVDGVSGQHDGRIDAFLGLGAHKAVLTMPPGTNATVNLKVSPFQELNAGTPPRLEDLMQISADLGDLQQRSYWLDITSRRTVFIEAAGRHLADLRLWRDGNWLVDAQPEAEEVMPRPGRPLAVRRLATTLEPGLYLLTAYGGPGVTWTEDSGDQPFHIRMGIPKLPPVMRREFTAGPLGRDRWLVPRVANHFHLEIPAAGSAAVEASYWNETHPISGERAIIDKTVRSRSAELPMGMSSNNLGYYLVTVERAAGERYVLEHYNASREQTLQGAGDYLITPLDPGVGEDGPDLTAVLSLPAERERVVQAAGLKLSEDTAWKRRFNLLDRVTLFLDVTQPGAYRLDSEGVEAEFTIQPLVIGSRAKVPAPQVRGGSWDLDAGLYVLSVTPRPDNRGIITVTLTGAKGSAPAEFSPRLNSFLAPVRLEGNKVYSLRLGITGGVGTGAVARRLPLDLGESEALVLLPAGGQVHLPVTVPAAGTLGFAADDGESLPFSVDGAQAGEKHVGPGQSAVTVSNPRPQSVLAALKFTADSTPAESPPPPLSPERLASLPNFPELVAGQRQTLDLARRQSATFAVKVGEPALYRLETTGLLQTDGNLRTQINPSLSRVGANGVGRNFLMQRYLREGLYQLTVATEGETTGHLGLSLSASPVKDGGPLEPGIAARASLGAGEGITYLLDIAEKGTYRIQAQALAGSTMLRLEDADGWPFTTPDQGGLLTRDLRPGRYHVVVLPQAMPARVVTTVDQVVPPTTYSGHGPHRLPLDGQVANRWDEPADGGDRVPDVWAFDLPAAATVTLTLGEGMEGTLYKDDGQTVAALNFRQPFTQRLAAGAYHLDVRTIRPNNRFDYTIGVATRELTVGRERQVSAPSELPIAIGEERLVEITSFGNADVRATLLDAAGNVVAHNDDRPDDWNFLIAARLKPGDYTLKVEAVGADAVAVPQSEVRRHIQRHRSEEDDDEEETDSSPAATVPAASATTTVRLSQQDEVTDKPLVAPGSLEAADGALHIVPLALPKDGPLVVATARSRDAAGLLLERQGEGGAWLTVGTATGREARLAVARDPAAGVEYRMRVWSLDHTKAPIAVSVRAIKPDSLSEKSVAEGATLSAVNGFEPPLAAAEVELDRPGLLQLDSPSPDLAWATTADRRALAHGGPVVTAGGRRVWLTGDAGARVKLRRVVPDAKAAVALTIGDGEQAVLPLTGDQRGPLLWIADSRVGQPGASVGPLDAAADARSFGVGQGLAVAVLPDTKATADSGLRLWRADGLVGELPVTLRQYGFAKVEEGNIGLGMADETVIAGGARRLALPPGGKLVRLALPPGVAMALLADGKLSRTLWSGGSPVAETLETSADHALILNTNAQPVRISALVAPAGDSGGLAKLSRGALARQWQADAGTTRFEVAANDRPLTITLAGAADSGVMVQRDGVVRQGRVLTATADATLLVRHGPGLVAVWADGPDEAAWPAAAAAQPAPAVPGAGALAGAEAVWGVDSPSAGLLHIAGGGPVVSGVRRPGAAPEVAAWPRGVDLHLFVPAGRTVVGFRPLAGGALGGSVVLARSEPVTIGEGLGPAVQLAPGDARLFAFEVKRDGPIGVGVQGSADSARVRLLDDKGEILAEGTVAMKVLPAGRYFLLAENRADAAAVEIRPALVGVTRPDTGPPEEVRRSYWKLVSEEGDKDHE